MSYDDALAYAKWAGKRLPTVREWEIAASWDPIERKNLKYPWGNELKPDRANLGGTGPEPVGSRPGDISPGGLHDMAGNISEWSSTRDGKKIVVCGGSWADVPEAARCDTQFPYDTGTRSTRLGFRCVKDAQ